ncbi:YceG family protein [Clostridium sp. DL1XJH146]
MDNNQSSGMQFSMDSFKMPGTENDTVDNPLEKNNKKENNKEENIILWHSTNVFEDMCQTIEGKKKHNLANETKNNLSIILCRYSGFDDKKIYLSSIKKLHERLLSLNNLYKFFYKGIPILLNEHITNIVSNRIDNGLDVKKTDFRILLNETELFNHVEKSKVNKSFKEAFFIVLEKYIDSETRVNASKVKSFIVKLISWSKEYISVLFRDEIVNYNPKIVYFGEAKKHECYFFILLSLLGCDVVVFEPEGEKQWHNIDKFGKYSFRYEGRYKEDLKENPFIVENKNTTTSNVVKRTSNERKTNSKFQPIPNGSPIIGTRIKKTLDIFTEIKLPTEKRGGYLQGSNPIVPVYFYRYIGLEEGELAQEEYSNKIYLLDKEFEKQEYNYIKFIDRIPSPSNSELGKIINIIDRIFKGKTTVDVEYILNEVYRNKLLPQSSNVSLNNSFKYALMEVFNMYLANENPNVSKTKNLLVKFIVWINKYSKNLFKNIKADSLDVHNPKILYYGEIKYTEVYLLIYFSRIGCDVLYLNTEYKSDDIFARIDKEEQYTVLQKNEISRSLMAFPTEEKIIRKSTVAYNASNEIQEMLFNPDTGMYKPWQFQEYNTIPVTLKTTFEEIKILWSEEARIRPNFKIANNTVYVPNLFSKINGTYTDLSKYWSVLSELSAADDTYFIEKLPFSRVNYTREDVFSLAYVLNRDGTVDKEKLIKNKFYNYSHLKNSLQDFIISKINEVIKSNYFCREVDNKFSLKILMTILNMQDDILNLIQKFDFPHYIPKVIVYVNDKSDFSEEDIITLVLLNIIGIDVLVFAPTNYNNIENHIKQYAFDVHQLEDFKLDLPLNLNKKEPKSFFSKIFKMN